MKQEFISAAHSFIATFIVTFATAVAAVPADHFFSAQTWTYSLLAGIAVAAVRAGVKAISPLNA